MRFCLVGRRLGDRLPRWHTTFFFRHQNPLYKYKKKKNSCDNTDNDARKNRFVCPLLFVSMCDVQTPIQKLIISTYSENWSKNVIDLYLKKVQLFYCFGISHQFISHILRVAINTVPSANHSVMYFFFEIVLDNTTP